MKENILLMRDAKASLKGKWGAAALATLVYVLVVCASGALFIGPFLIAGPMLLGYIGYIKRMKAGENPGLEVLFTGFNDFLRSFLAYLLMMIFICLWSLLLWIPGIIMAIAYSMTFYILSDNKDISAMDAIRLSKKMMRGYKWKYFCLMFRFIGWMLLTALTFGILSFWVAPYIQMSTLNFYHEVKAAWEAGNNK